MTLQQELDQIRERIESKVPAQNLKIMHQATSDLEASGIRDKILKVGDKAPAFSLQNQQGESVSSEKLLEKGALVISFYRGVWCPYCNSDLAALENYHAKIKELGATLISISPQIPSYNQQIVEKQKLNFDLLSDQENEVAHQFGLRWSLVDPLKSLYNDTFNINLPTYNGDESWTLPVPARFIIGQDGIKYAEFSIDYTKRPNPDVLIETLKA